MRVFVKNQRGEALMPCTQRKARILLKEGKARILTYAPFAIQLIEATGETVQEVSLGIDSGALFAGVAVTSGEKVLIKGTIRLRTGVKDLLANRTILRRGRRSRNTRYRKSKFRYSSSKRYNAKKKKWEKRPRSFSSPRDKGWLPPSIRHRVDNQIFWIEKFRDLLPNPKVTVEVGKFDVQKMMNPDISGVQYQQGETAGFYSTRYFVFARDKYKCVVCKGKSKDPILQTHHRIPRSQGGTDRASNLATVCMTCHKGYHNGTIQHDFKKPRQYKEPPFMNAFRMRILRHVDCTVTYGSQTTPDRKDLGLEKSHSNDAVAISGIRRIKEMPEREFFIQQSRKKKRSLHEATARKGKVGPNTLSRRNGKNTKHSEGFHLNDCVRLFGRIGWVCGFTSGGVYVKDSEGKYITLPDKTYKQVPARELVRLSHNNNWLYRG